ncbi:MAG: DUF4861 domain-containing protein [Bacteroidaceae bacterium]|nr:DUF4861 domain-containing protein [Bacteroidaceae bacterium]
MKKLLFFSALFYAASSFAADKVTVKVSNPADVIRANEVVEVSLDAVKKKLNNAQSFIVTDADGNEIASQITHDGKLIFQVGVAAKGKSVYYVTTGSPKQYDTKAKGRLFTERGDEFGWENDRVAYRIYGHGGAVGYDLFNKSTDEMMLDYWYASEQNQEMRNVSRDLHTRGYHDLADQVYNAYCYHIDHGKGMDCYTVGPTLGGGADALVNADGSLCMPKCYKKYEILDKGPLRFTVKLTYPEINYANQKVVETRIITLDAGSQFNKVSVSFDGLTGNPQIASGVVVHKQNPTAYVLSQKNGYVGYEDLGDASVYNKKYQAELAKQMGKIYVGTIYPGKLSEVKFMERANGIATGHALGIGTYKDGYTYFFGTGWSKNPNTGFDNLTKWEAHLSDTAKKVKNPLKISVK